MGQERNGRRISRRQFATGASTAVLGASLHTRRDARASQVEMATAASPVSDAATPIASPRATPGATPLAGPLLEVTPPKVGFDERFDIRIFGVEPGQPVTITSRVGKYGPSWTATATYTAQALYGDPSFGYVDPGAMVPVEGSFEVADTMAFIWAAQAPGDPWYLALRQGETETVTITALAGDIEIGSATVERSIPEGAERPMEVSEDGLVGRFFHPPAGSATPAPAVIVIGGSEGGLSPYGDLIASVLAGHGYATLNLAYWKAGDLPPVFENIPIEYFGTAIRWLQRQPAVDPERIAIHGTSRGGEGAMLTGAYFPEIKAVISNGGSGLVVGAPWSATPVPAWTWRGEPLPFDGMPGLTAEDVAEVEIPVERIDGPVLLIAGDGDGLWPASFLSRFALDRLRRHDHAWADQLLRYPGAGHAIGVPYGPVAPSLGTFMPGVMFGGNAHSNAIAEANSWAAILAMLDARLKSPS